MNFHVFATALLFLCLGGGFCPSAETPADPARMPEPYAEVPLPVLRQRAQAGDAYFQGWLGESYKRGDRVNADHLAALEWLERAAAQKDPLALAHLAHLTLLGTVTPKDADRARRLAEEAFPGVLRLAEDGDARARSCCVLLYLCGLGTGKDPQRAFVWNTRAMLQMYPRAWRDFPPLMEAGLGTPAACAEIEAFLRKQMAAGNEPSRWEWANLLANGYGVTKAPSEAEALFAALEAPTEDPGETAEGDVVIPGLLPPRYVLALPEGSCGEACLWTVARARGIRATQLSINVAGGHPGRGLHGNELDDALRAMGIPFRDRWVSVRNSDPAKVEAGYEAFLQGVLEALKRGRPVLLGVKVTPSASEKLFCDHFVLAVGFNPETKEIIYNDFNARKRIPAERLLAPGRGYTFRNGFGRLFCIEFPLPERKTD